MEPEVSISIPEGVQQTTLWYYLKQNAPFYVVLMVCVYILAWAGNRSFLNTFFTTLLVWLCSYWFMYLSSNTLYLPWYNGYDTLLTRCSCIDTLVRQFISPSDASSSQGWKYACDVLKAGGFIMLTKWVLQLANTKAILFWTLLYPTVHNINYLYLKPLAHMEHHVDPLTNYGMDIWDLIVGTKHDWANLELHNHAAINCVFITVFILWLWRRRK